MSTPSPQDVEATGRAAYDAACTFVGLPTIAAQIASATAAVQVQLDTATNALRDSTAANATLTKNLGDANAANLKLTDQLATIKADAQADVTASQKVLTDAGG